MTHSIQAQEIVSLVHHVELGKVGWWDRAFQRLVLGVLWLADESLGLNAILRELKNAGLGRSLSRDKLESMMQQLCDANMVMQVGGGRYKIAEVTRTEFDDEIDSIQSLESSVKAKFLDLLRERIPSIATDETWKLFREDFLLPLFEEHGAKVYELLSGERASIEKNLPLTGFLRLFDSSHKIPLIETINNVLDSGDKEMRAYILRRACNNFCVSGYDVY